jgi:uncharacterized repeat protein (TIGR03803 family)
MIIHPEYARFQDHLVLETDPRFRIILYWTILHCTDGEYPGAALIQGTGGNFYGTTYPGGANNSGEVFQITSSGALTSLYSFCAQSECSDGADPIAGVIQATNGNLYGTTYLGGGQRRRHHLRNHAGRRAEDALQLLLP